MLAVTQRLSLTLVVLMGVLLAPHSAQAQSSTSEWCVGYGENYRTKSRTTVKEADACTTRCGARGTKGRSEIQGGCACDVKCPTGARGGCSFNITKGNCATPRTYEEPTPPPPQRPAHCPPPKTSRTLRPDGCPDVTGIQRTKSGECRCPDNQVIMVDECGNPACKPWLLPPTSGPGVIYGPTECPWKDRSAVPACKKYCDECLSKEYGWSTISEFLFIFQAKTELLMWLNNKQSLGKNGEILSCLRSFLGAVGQMTDATASSDMAHFPDHISETAASNLATLACAAKDCLSHVSGTDPFSTIPGGKAWSTALDMACTVGDHMAQRIRCGAAHLDCESTYHGAQPIPQCKGLSSNPVLSGQKKIEPTNACLDCCSAQVLHVFEKCQKKKTDPSCQYYMNMCLGTC